MNKNKTMSGNDNSIPWYLLVAYAVSLVAWWVVNRVAVPCLLYQPPGATYRGNQNPIIVDPRTGDDASSNPAIIFLHGNACTADMMVPQAQILANRLHRRVYLLEYAGYGALRNRARADNFSQLLDIAAEIYRNHGSSQVIMVGQSLGAYFATRLAAVLPPQKLVLISPFYSIQLLAQDLVGLPDWLCKVALYRNEFDTAKYLRQVAPNIHVQIIHGADDRLIPVRHAELLQKIHSAGAQLIIYPHQDHNGFDFQKIAQTISE